MPIIRIVKNTIRFSPNVYTCIISRVYTDIFLVDAILGHVTSLDVSIDFPLLLKNTCTFYIVYILHGTDLLERGNSKKSGYFIAAILDHVVIVSTSYY